MTMHIRMTNVPGYTFVSSRERTEVMVIPKRIGSSVEILLSRGPTAETRQINCVNEATKDIEIQLSSTLLVSSQVSRLASVNDIPVTGIILMVLFY